MVSRAFDTQDVGKGTTIIYRFLYLSDIYSCQASAESREGSFLDKIIYFILASVAESMR